MSDEEAIVKVNEEDTDEDVRGYAKISVISKNDDQSKNEVNKDNHNEVENFEVYVQNNSKVNPGVQSWSLHTAKSRVKSVRI